MQVAAASRADESKQLEDYYDSMVDFNLYDADNGEDAANPIGVDDGNEESSSADAEVDNPLQMLRRMGKMNHKKLKKQQMVKE